MAPDAFAVGSIMNTFYPNAGRCSYLFFDVFYQSCARLGLSLSLLLSDIELPRHSVDYIQYASFDHIKDALGAISVFQADDIAIDGFIYSLDRANKIIAEYLHHNPSFRRNDCVDNG